MKVLFLPEVQDFFLELAQILYEKDYFGFEESAIQYAEELFSDIEDSLPQRLKKVAPEYFAQYGPDMYYAIFKKNKRTKWYVFFSIYKTESEEIYLVRYISNNHVIAHKL